MNAVNATSDRPTSVEVNGAGILPVRPFLEVDILAMIRSRKHNGHYTLQLSWKEPVDNQSPSD